MVDVENEAPRDDNGLLKRPCLEEFMSAGYTAEQYDVYFGENYGPGWSDPTWTPPVDVGAYEEAVLKAVAELPAEFHVQSKVRHVTTRTTRVQQPTRHRFKQYLFADPSKRLVRRRPVRISASQLVRNINELIQKEKAGILSVHLIDGRRIDLKQLLDGIPAVTAARPATPLYNRRLDSIAYDTPSGIPLAQYVDGTFPGDPAAQRATERMIAEKQHEAARQGANEKDEPPEGILDDEPTSETTEEQTEETAAYVDDADEVTVVEETIPDVVDSETAAPAFESTMDPAAERSVEHTRSKKGGKRR